MHRAQIKHRTQSTKHKRFVLSDVCIPILLAKSRILDKVGTFGLYLCFVSLGFVFFFSFAFASETNGTIVSGGNNGYAWSDQAGWVNFGCTNCGISITDSGITGYAWNSNYGWINMDPSNSSVSVAANGALSGHAWGSGLGWVNFSGVTINSSGKFTGQGTGANIGMLTFDCANCSVTTDFRSQNFRTVSLTPSPTPPGGGGGGGGGGSAAGPLVSAPDGTLVPAQVNSFNAPLSIVPNQSGILELFVDNDRKVIVNVPPRIADGRITLIAYDEPLTPAQNLDLLPAGVDLANSVFYNITARDENNNFVKSFSDFISITLPLPAGISDTSDLGIFWLDEDAGIWKKVPDAVFSTDSNTVTFSVNHLTRFGIFRVLSELLETLPVPAVPEILPPRQPLPLPGIPSAGTPEISPEELLPEELFDIRLLLDRAAVSRVADLVARATFTSFGRVPTPVNMRFTIIDSRGNEVWESVDTTTVETEEVFVKRFLNVGELVPGSYKVRLRTLYNIDVIDVFESPFTILSPEEVESYWLAWLIGGLVVLIVFFFLWRKRTAETRNERNARKF